MKLTTADMTVRFSTDEESKQTDDDVLMIISLFIEKNVSRQRVLNAILILLSMMFKKDFPDENERMKAIDEIARAIKINSANKNESDTVQ